MELSQGAGAGSYHILDYIKKGRFHCLFRLIKELSLCLPEVYVFPDLPHFFFKYRKFEYRKV